MRYESYRVYIKADSLKLCSGDFSLLAYEPTKKLDNLETAIAKKELSDLKIKMK